MVINLLFSILFLVIRILLVLVRIALWVLFVFIGVIVDIAHGLFLLLCLPAYLILGALVVIKYSISNPTAFFSIGSTGKIPDGFKEESRRLNLHAKIITLIILILLKYFTWIGN